ncbi:MAG: zinc protease [Maribacter sp.]|jgi:zinc protease
MNRILLPMAILLGVFSIVACNKKINDATKETVKSETEDMIGLSASEDTKYDYESVPGDPIGVKMYTLKNGMKVYMSVNKNEPRIQTNIAVRAGSKHDPADATGLAHYLEHMMFKGTSEIGTLDWDAEQEKLKEISDLYEKHRSEIDPAKRSAIYAKIDQVSNDAAKLVAANEYDKMVTSLGAKGTNAYTSVEQTVYVNDIPSNELEKWMQLESERFQECVLRLFHTELEAVYEEFNINQDRDFRKSNSALSESLFPSHPYGTQTTIGKGEHLKNPSHVKIQEYFNKYYVPNNMAIVISGDIDPDDVVAKVEKYFGSYEAKEMDRPVFPPQPNLTKRVEKVVYGQQDPYVDFAWKFDGVGSADPIMLQMLKGILNNGKAGLLDININQKQTALEADAWVWPYEDYSVFGLFGKPKEGQSLKELEELLLAEVDNLKAGKFDDWLMKAVIKNLKLSEIRAAESNQARVGAMTNAFVRGLSWDDYVNRMNDMDNITKQEVIDFAKKYLRRDNYVVVYKKLGEDKETVKVDKPSITPVSLNREQSSEFTEEFMAKKSASLAPTFVNYKEAIQKQEMQKGLSFEYMKNEDNELFSLLYIVEMGKNHDKKLPMAVDYLKYLGTDKYTAKQLQEEFFKLGLSFNVSSGNERVYVSLSGLEESMEKGIDLFEHILANAKGDKTALENVKGDMMLRRKNAKTDKNAVRRQGLTNYARYGDNSAFTDVLPEAEINAITPDELVQKVRNLSSYEHTVFYYGTKSKVEAASMIKKYHKAPAILKPIPEGKKYKEVGGTKNEVYFVEFPMVQAEVLMMSKGTEKFSLEQYIMAELYNNYFGFGLSSIMFQEIRESRALAYSTYAFYGSPSKKDNAHYLQAYVGTQANKLPDAVAAVREILNDMPVSDEQIETAKNSILKKIETERINGSDKYWQSRAAAERGMDRDIREDVYKKMKTVTVDELKEFQQNNVKDREFVIMVMGTKENIGEKGMEYLKTLGDVKELSLEELFGY